MHIVGSLQTRSTEHPGPWRNQWFPSLLSPNWSEGSPNYSLRYTIIIHCLFRSGLIIQSSCYHYCKMLTLWQCLLAYFWHQWLRTFSSCPHHSQTQVKFTSLKECNIMILLEVEEKLWNLVWSQDSGHDAVHKLFDMLCKWDNFNVTVLADICFRSVSTYIQMERQIHFVRE